MHRGSRSATGSGGGGAALRALACAGWMSIAVVAGGWAQEEAAPAGGEAGAAPAAALEEAVTDDFRPQVVIHGHLSQAYGRSEGNQIVGIPEDGTSDYRTAAVQIRADMTASDAFALQLSHERLGDSRIQTLHDDVELDWVFYQRRLGNTAVKVGRVPIPFGIYNEVRDVGTVLPFYRPARPMYEETSFATETADGVLVSHAFASSGAWHLEGAVHYGTWKTFDSVLRPIEAGDSLGAEIWLTTPVDGLRLGIGGLRYDALVGSGTTSTRSDRQLSHFSVDGDFGRLKAQFEVKRDTAQFVSGGSEVKVWGGYGYLGFKLTEPLALHAEYDFLDVKRAGTDKAPDRDRALGVSYRFRPDLVLKAEYHWVRGFRVDNRPGLVPGRPVPQYDTRFGIVSLATSF